MKLYQILWGGFFFLILPLLSAQELVINYQYHTGQLDQANYLSFRSPLRYVGVEKDRFDSISGASQFKATALFSPIQTDMLGRAVFPSGVRGLLLFPVASPEVRLEDNLRVTKGSNGVITIEYVHRGVAYKIATDKTGKLGFPRGNFFMRTIGYIEGHGPQVLAKEFSADGTADLVDWKKVWDPRIAAGKEITPGKPARTGVIQKDYGDLTALFNWDGVLQLVYEEPVLTISGSLKPVKR